MNSVQQPLVKQLPYRNPAEVLKQFADEPYLCFLDSSATNPINGRYSFLAFAPFKTFRSSGNKIFIDDQEAVDDPFTALQHCLQAYKSVTIPGLPPFQGGAAGYFAYELLQQIEDISVPIAATSDDICLGFYDLVIAWDHNKQQLFVFSHGLPEVDPDRRRQRAQLRLDYVLLKLALPVPDVAVVEGALAGEITSNFTRSNYAQMVQTVRDYIYAGDIFQANVAQQFSAVLKPTVTPLQLYLQLRAANPAPFAAYLNFPSLTVTSSSPERFLAVRYRIVDTFPIKGTRPRSIYGHRDKAMAKELMTSAKDNAENTMIVDLMRNDLSRVCIDDSVEVKELCGLYSFATVHHLISHVQAKLRPDLDAVDLLQAAFPGGSITGAPKVRAMEIIAELEQCPRELYCGSIAYLGFDGAMDSSIVIRTMLIKDRNITFNAGGGIVADSDPQAEYSESVVKAQALIDLLQGRSIDDLVAR